MNDLEGFLDYLAHGNFSETELAVKVAFWINENYGTEETVTVSEIISFITEHKLKSAPNSSRLKSRLNSIRGVSVDASNRVVLRRATQNELREELSKFFEEPKTPIQETILNLGLVDTINRVYASNIARQINACYQFELYDACAVMMRRLSEILIVEAFDRALHISDISNPDGSLLGFENLIGKYCCGTFWHVGRNTSETLTRVKLLGDTAAHDRRYETKMRDIDDITQRYRVVIEEQVKIILENDRR